MSSNLPANKYNLNESKKITDKLALKLKGRPYFIQDTELKGFWLRVPANDLKGASYQVNTKPQGGRKSVRYSIGSISVYKAKEAREIARDWIQKIKSGVDPKEEARKQNAQSQKLEEAFNQYVSEKSSAGNFSEASFRNYKQSMGGRLASLMGKRINNLTEEMVSSWYKKNSLEAPGLTDRAYRELNAVLSYQVAIKNLASNPADVVKVRNQRVAIKPKTSYLTIEECGNLVNEMVSFRDNDARLKQTNLLLFQLLTGLRESNVYNLKWSQVILRDSVTFEFTKNGEAYFLPLIPILNDILEQQRVLVPRDCVWVFPNKNFDGPTVDPRKMLNNLYQKAGIKKRFSDHDLRRTFSSLADLAKVPFLDIKHLMIHKKSDITAEYLQSQQIKANENYRRIADFLAGITPVSSEANDECQEVVNYMTVDMLRYLLFDKGKLSRDPNRFDHSFLNDVSRPSFMRLVEDEWD